MKTRIIGVKETARGCWKLTFNGHILGDSRGYSRDEAVREARKFVARDGGLDGDWEGSTWVEFRNVLDKEIDA